MLLFNRDLVNHRLNGCQLLLTAKRHQNGTCTDGRVKAFGKTALRANVKVSNERFVARLKVGYRFFFVRGSISRSNGNVLLCTIRVQKFTGKVDNRLTVPVHTKTGFFSNLCHNGSFKVFGKCERHKGIHVFLFNNNCHSFLRFGNCKFSTVKTVVLLRNSVKIDIKAVSKFTNSNRNTARTKVVTPLDHTGSFGIAEKSLELSFFRSITLLYFCTAGFERRKSVFFGRAGCTAASVTTGTAAKQNNNVTVFRAFTTNVCRRSRCNNRTDFHSLRSIAVVEELVNHTGSKTDLVTVRGITCRSSGHDLSLRKFTLDGFRNCFCRVCTTGHTHCGINVRSAGKRVADRAADTSSGTAKGLNFGRMVVGFVLEQKEPRLFYAVNLNVHLDSTSIDFFRFIKLIKMTVLFQVANGKSGNIHQILRLGSAKSFTGSHIFVIGFLKEFVLKGHFVNSGKEGRMTAMVRPISVDHTNFGNGGISLFHAEIVTAETDIIGIHSKTVSLDEFSKSFFVKINKAVKSGNLGRNIILHSKRCRQCKRCFSGFYGVDHVLFNFCKLFRGKLTLKNVYTSCTNGGSFAAGDDLDALCSRVSTLVKLTGQIFHSKNSIAFSGKFFGYDIKLRLRKYGVHSISKQIFSNVFHIVTIEKANVGNAFHAEKIANFGKDRFRFIRKTFSFFNKNSKDHIRFSPCCFDSNLVSFMYLAVQCS